MTKIQANRNRDFRDQNKLLETGWRILTIWECALKGKLKRPMSEVMQQVSEWILENDKNVPLLSIRHS